LGFHCDHCDEDLKVLPLEQAASELLAYNEEHPFDVLLMKPPGAEYDRFVTYNGEAFFVCLTKLVLPGSLADMDYRWMLSVARPPGPKDQVPTVEEVDGIAKAFFQEGHYAALPTEMQIIPMSCRKFIGKGKGGK
jgi:hypothetical protein